MAPHNDFKLYKEERRWSGDHVSVVITAAVVPSIVADSVDAGAGAGGSG